MGGVTLLLHFLGLPYIYFTVWLFLKVLGCVDIHHGVMTFGFHFRQFSIRHMFKLSIKSRQF